MGRIYDYKAHYLELQRQTCPSTKAYDEQQRMIADNRTFIDRFRNVF
jgi:ATP-binding cassette subfamily F protein 3